MRVNMRASNKTRKTRYTVNISCKADKENPRNANVPPLLLPVSDVGHEDDHQGPTRFVASTRGHRTGRPGHN